MRGRWTCETEKINPINVQPTNHSVSSLKANKFHCRGRGTKRLSKEGKRSTPKSPLFPNLIHDVARERRIGHQKDNSTPRKIGRISKNFDDEMALTRPREVISPRV